MDTTISGSIFLNLLQVLLVLSTLTFRTGDQKHTVTFPASAWPERLWGAGALFPRPARPPSGPGAARLFSARRGPARSAFGCFRSHSRLAAETLRARAADVGPAGG